MLLKRDEVLIDTRGMEQIGRDLIVRVADYSDYFIDLTPQLQEEIMTITAHQGIS